MIPTSKSGTDELISETFFDTGWKIWGECFPQAALSSRYPTTFPNLVNENLTSVEVFPTASEAFLVTSTHTVTD
jgi:hypothetical protein